LEVMTQPPCKKCSRPKESTLAVNHKALNGQHSCLRSVQGTAFA